ncbi:hypothetical protein LTR84_005573 [Exophiala bonariae]|uniref:BZIP domain-containing protein n=1 Tax=Exophiala bonariae TaxID=1690606 RepID=A0AAV9N2R6_9EURO|nr:hypothetical protein LTR84_005573 [Exophiala bonariae]
MAFALEQASVSLSIEMLGHNQARGIDELWAGISDIKERRKLQNRLNRRAYRKRQSELKSQGKHEAESSSTDSTMGHRTKRRKIPGSHVFSLDGEQSNHKSGHIMLSELIRSSKLSFHSPDSNGDRASYASQETMFQDLNIDGQYEAFQSTIQQSLLSPEQFDNLINPAVNDDESNSALLEARLNSTINAGPSTYLGSDHLITLIYYNVFRGLSKNIQALKLDLNLMRRKDYQSPFITGDYDLSTLAPDFHPTLIQRTFPHHPCFDIFPDAVVRDNAIKNWATDLPYGYLCTTLAGRRNWHEIELPARHSCVLWGDADNADNWEVTEAFASRWPYLVQGAYRLEAATNKWRALRGERPISFA